MLDTSFHLAIDDGGEFLVVSGTDITLGHGGGRGSSIPFRADLRARHAYLRWRTSFHGGPKWSVEPGLAQDAGGEVQVCGQFLTEAVDLVDGDEVTLSPRVQFRFSLPEPASSTAQLQLMRGIEVHGATKVLLFVPGTEGRIRIGPRKKRHVPVAGLEHEVSLELQPGFLKVSCEGGLREETDQARNLAELSTNKTVPCPPQSRIELRVNARPSQPLPFGLSLAPLDPFAS